MQVHKFPLCIVNDTVMIVIEHTNLFNPLFKIYLKGSQIMRPQACSWVHLNGVKYIRTN